MTREASVARTSGWWASEDSWTSVPVWDPTRVLLRPSITLGLGARTGHLEPILAWPSKL